MNTAQFTYALEQDPKTSKMFCGVFPSNKLVANTDPSTRPGAHWVSILMTSQQMPSGSIHTENPRNSTGLPSLSS